MSPAPIIDLHTHRLYPKDSPILSVYNATISRPAPTEPRLYSLGIHPWYEDLHTDQTLSTIEQRMLSESRVWAIGEIGLDKLCTTPWELQLHYCSMQAQLAQNYSYPCIIHSVRATSDLLSLRKRLRYENPWIFHGFRGKSGLARQLIDAGCHLSMGRYNHPESLFWAYRCGRLLLETDDQSSVTIEEIYQQCAHTLNIPVEKLRESLYQTFCSIKCPT